MNMTCKIAMDLAELYQNDLVSEESAGEIRAHLKNCPSCRRYYRDFSRLDRRERAAQHPDTDDLSGIEARLYQDLSKRLARRRFFEVVGTGAAVGAGTIMVAIGIVLMTKRRGM